MHAIRRSVLLFALMLLPCDLGARPVSTPSDQAGATVADWQQGEAGAGYDLVGSLYRLDELIFGDGFETGICNGPWSSFVGEDCPACPTESGLQAVLTKQILSVAIDGSCTLRIEIITLTNRPLEVIADGIVTPPDPVLQSQTSTCSAFTETDFRCVHNTYFAYAEGETGDGDYTLMLQGACDPLIANCPLCSAPQEVNFSTTGTSCAAAAAVRTSRR